MALVLVVDDEQNVRKILRRWLEYAGHQANEADSADAALESMAATPADVVFCDVQMPGRDGLWLTRELRTRYPLSAVILATGLTTVPPRISMQAGVMAYLVKPFDRTGLLEALAVALEWHQKAATAGPQPAEDPNRLKTWLDSLRDI